MANTKIELITGEHFKNTDQTLIKEYNDLTYELNRYIWRLSSEEILTKYTRVKELVSLLGIGEPHQLTLF